MNRIVIELCPEDRERLDRVIRAMERVTGLGEAAEPAAPSIVEPVVVADAVVPEPETIVTEEDIRQAYIRLARTHKKAQAQQLIKQYADKISDVPADKRAEVLDKLTALEAEA